jgi:RNA polymerase sigma-70 factor, ECF subfamily
MHFTSLRLRQELTPGALLAPGATPTPKRSRFWNEPTSVVMLGSPSVGRKREMNHQNIEAIVRQHLSTVFRVLRRAGVSLADCDDLTQEVFLIVSRRLGDIEAGKERAFCMGVAVRKASDYRRAQARRPRLVDDARLEVISFAPSPEQLSVLSSQLNRLDALLQKLTPEQQEVFILVAIEEFSFEEAALALGVPTGTVSSRLHRARASLEALIQGKHPEKD